VIAARSTSTRIDPAIGLPLVPGGMRHAQRATLRTNRLL
jgi:hypothetical protein